MKRKDIYILLMVLCPGFSACVGAAIHEPAADESYIYRAAQGRHGKDKGLFSEIVKTHSDHNVLLFRH